jgi:hypothetical protein
MNSMNHTASIISAIPVEANIEIPLSISQLIPNSNFSNSIPNVQSSSNVTNNSSNNIQTQVSHDSTAPLPTTTTSSASTSQQPTPQSQPRMPRLLSNAFSLPYPSPLPPLMPNISTLNSYDQYLPCNSVHFYNLSNSASTNSILQSIPVIPPFQLNNSQQTNRRRHPAGNQQQRDQQPIQQNSTSQNADTSSEQRQTADINRLLNNSISGALHNAIHNAIHNASSSGQNSENEAMSHIRVNIGSLPNNGISITTISTTDNTPAHSTNSTPIFASPGSSTNSENRQSTGNYLTNIFEQIFLARPAQQSGQAQPQTQTSGSLTASQNIIREAISLMNSNNNNSQRLNQPLSELFQAIDSSDNTNASDETMTPSSSSSIIGALFSSMTFGDMINLATGANREFLFERSIAPLREHISTHFLENNEFNDQNINALTDRLYNDLFFSENVSIINFDQFELTDNGVDLKKSFEMLIKHHIKAMLNHVFDTSFGEPQLYSGTAQQTRSAESTWTSALINKFFALIEETIALCRATIKDADNVFTQTVTAKISQTIISQNIFNNQMFDYIINNFIRIHIRQFVEQARKVRQDIEKFIIMKESNKKESVSNDNVQVCSKFLEDDNSLSKNSIIEPIAMKSMERNYDTSKSDSTCSDRKSSPIRSSLISTELVQSLPSEWIDTVENDIINQNNFSHNIAFSDAYCAGMPAKRRKIFATAEQSLPECLFKKIFSKTIRQVQLKNDSSYEKILEGTHSTPEILKSFNYELDMIINERLRTDKDFNQIKENEHKNDNNDNEFNKNNKNRFPNLRKRFR